MGSLPHRLAARVVSLSPHPDDRIGTFSHRRATKVALHNSGEPFFMTLQQLIAFSCTVLLIAGCATQESNGQQTATAARSDCVKTVGSNICRVEGSGNPNAVVSVSGDDLRRSGGPLTGPLPGKTGD
jgi:hypothetical protein